MSILVWSPLGVVRLSLSHAHIGLPKGFNSNFPTCILVTYMGVIPRVSA